MPTLYVKREISALTRLCFKMQPFDLKYLFLVIADENGKISAHFQENADSIDLEDITSHLLTRTEEKACWRILTTLHSSGLLQQTNAFMQKANAHLNTDQSVSLQNAALDFLSVTLRKYWGCMQETFIRSLFDRVISLLGNQERGNKEKCLKLLSFITELHPHTRTWVSISDLDGMADHCLRGITDNSLVLESELESLKYFAYISSFCPLSSTRLDFWTALGLLIEMTKRPLPISLKPSLLCAISDVLIKQMKLDPSCTPNTIEIALATVSCAWQTHNNEKVVLKALKLLIAFILTSYGHEQFENLSDSEIEPLVEIVGSCASSYFKESGNHKAFQLCLKLVSCIFDRSVCRAKLYEMGILDRLFQHDFLPKLVDFHDEKAIETNYLLLECIEKATLDSAIRYKLKEHERFDSSINEGSTPIKIMQNKSAIVPILAEMLHVGLNGPNRERQPDAAEVLTFRILVFLYTSYGHDNALLAYLVRNSVNGVNTMTELLKFLCNARASILALDFNPPRIKLLNSTQEAAGHLLNAILRTSAGQLAIIEQNRLSDLTSVIVNVRKCNLSELMLTIITRIATNQTLIHPLVKYRGFSALYEPFLQDELRNEYLEKITRSFMPERHDMITIICRLLDFSLEDGGDAETAIDCAIALGYAFGSFIVFSCIHGVLVERAAGSYGPSCFQAPKIWALLLRPQHGELAQRVSYTLYYLSKFSAELVSRHGQEFTCISQLAGSFSRQLDTISNNCVSISFPDDAHGQTISVDSEMLRSASPVFAALVSEDFTEATGNIQLFDSRYETWRVAINFLQRCHSEDSCHSPVLITTKNLDIFGDLMAIGDKYLWPNLEAECIMWLASCFESISVNHDWELALYLYRFIHHNPNKRINTFKAPALDKLIRCLPSRQFERP